MSSTTRKLTAAAAASVLAATAFCCALPAGTASAAGSAPKISMELLAGGSAIGMEIYIDLPDSDTPADCRIEFDGETPELTAVNGEWMFTASEYAMNMTKEHTLKITANDGSYTVNEPISVASYLAPFTDDPVYGTLACAMLLYGGAAQTYFDVNTDHLASESVTDADYDNVVIDASAFDKTALAAALEADNAPVTYYGMNLSLKLETVFTLSFELAGDASLTDALDYLGGFSFGGSDAAVRENGTKYAEMSLTVPASGLTNTYTLEKGSISADFSPAQYLAAAVSGEDSALADVCKALYAYGDAAANFTPPAQPETPAKSDDFEVRTGRATTYDYQVGNAHLDDYVREHGAYAAALTDDDYAAYAGGMIEITCGTKSIRALVVDSMPLADNPGRRAGDVDLDPAAFQELTGATTGDFDITWKLIPNSYAADSDIQYHYEHGSSIYYCKIQPRNTTYPVAKFEYKAANSSKYTEVSKTSDNCYVLDPKSNPVMSFRITDIFGQVIEETDHDTGLTATELTDDLHCTEGTVQFPK